VLGVEAPKFRYRIDPGPPPVFEPHSYASAPLAFDFDGYGGDIEGVAGHMGSGC